MPQSINYEEILNSINAAIVIHEFKYGSLRPIWVSDNIGDIIRNDKEYWLTRGFNAPTDILHPDDHNIMMDFAKALEKDGYYHGFQRHKDANTGEYFWIYVNFKIFNYDKFGNIEKIIGVATYVNDGFHSIPQFQYLFAELLANTHDDVKNVLSKREYEIALKIADGLRDHEIAEYLNISTNTIRNHRQKIFKKLDIHSSVDLVKKMYTPSI